MHILLAIARGLGAVVVLVPLGVIAVISYTFGSSTFGAGSPIYGIMWASFGIVAAVCTFPALSPGPANVRLASGLVVVVCLGCSIAAGLVSLGSRQAQIAQVDLRSEQHLADMRVARETLLALPEHRDEAAVLAEQKLRSRTKRKGDEARDLELINELATIRKADELRARIDRLAANQSTGPRATAAIDWVARKIGWTSESAGQAMMLAFVVAGDLVSALGLFCLFGTHSFGPRSRKQEPEPIMQPEPTVEQAPELKQEIAQPAVEIAPEPDPAPTLEATTDDPVAAFLAEALLSDPDAVTPYAEIEQAWLVWCKSRGIEGVAVNLGFALRRAGYQSVKMENRRMGRKGLRLAA